MICENRQKTLNLLLYPEKSNLNEEKANNLNLGENEKTKEEDYCHEIEEKIDETNFQPNLRYKRKKNKKKNTKRSSTSQNSNFETMHPGYTPKQNIFRSKIRKIREKTVISEKYS